VADALSAPWPVSAKKTSSRLGAAIEKALDRNAGRRQAPSAPRWASCGELALIDSTAPSALRCASRPVLFEQLRGGVDRPDP